MNHPHRSRFNRAVRTAMADTLLEAYRGHHIYRGDEYVGVLISAEPGCQGGALKLIVTGPNGRELRVNPAGLRAEKATE